MSDAKDGPSKFAYRRTEKVRAALEQAKKEILEEIKDNDGIYPRNGGALSQAELCRRAGVAQATLQNATHRATTLVAVNKWLREVRASSVSGRTSVNSTITKRVDRWKEDYQRVATHYNVSRLEVADLKDKLATTTEELVRARERITELESEVALLRSDRSQGNVVRFPGGKTGA
jgi:hypothetical protein